MTFAVLAALAATVLFVPASNAQEKYTVWSSVIFTRTGERTPEILSLTPKIPTQLTSYGAWQQYANGQFFRQRYLTSLGSANGLDSAPIAGISPHIPDARQIYLFGLDLQYTVASAQAFMQGFYPPFQLLDNDTEVQMAFDPTSMLANLTYIESPLDGYQYTQVHAAGGYDPEYPYLGATIECQAFAEANIEYTSTEQFVETQAAASSVYQDVGPVLLEGVLDPLEWDYINAYVIYDYLSYLNVHNNTVQSLFSDPAFIDPASNVSFLDSLRWYADQQQYAQLGNLYAVNNVTSQPWPEGIMGSISTLGGNMLAAKMVTLLLENINSGGELYKFSLLVGDFQPLVSFFALNGLPALDSHFYGLPDFASVAVMELFSKTDPSDGIDYPSVDDLWVRFYFRNGSNPNEDYRAYPLFSLGPDQFEMTWGSFVTAMANIMIGDIGFWCQQCGTEITDPTRVFCSYWNTSDSMLDWGNSGSSSPHHTLSPVLGGVIGALVALVVAGIIFGIIMLIGGVRFHRVHSRKSELGGFKGSQKLASDKDLTLPKGGAIVGATVETPGSPVPGGHERVGSWELKQHDLPNIDATHPARRPSFEDDDDDVDISNRKPVRPDERV